MKNTGILLLAAGAFVAGTAELVVGGVLKPIGDDLGVSIALAGQLITAFSLAFAIGTPIVVALTSRIGRKTLLLYSLAVFALGNLITFFSSDFGIILISRAIVGLASGVFTVVAFSSAAKLTEPSQIGRAVGTVVLGVSVSMVIGIPLGIALADWRSWRIIVAGLALLAAGVLLLIAKYFPSVAGDAPIPFTRQFSVLKSPTLAAGFAFSFFFSTSSSTMNSYVTPYLQNIVRLNTTELGYMMLALGAFSVIGSRAGGAWTDRWGTKRLLLGGLGALAATLALLPPLGGAAVPALAVLLLWMFSMALVIPATQTYFIRQAPDRSNLVLGLNTSILHLGVAAGAGIGGFAAEAAASVRYHPWLASAAAVLSLIMAAVSMNRGQAIERTGKNIATSKSR
ncbi:MFS transporter [Cohnella cellulosilytica]|uniref:MFS transporter n=1 Tax=Cohnella cellulosilytica TaxID=986710 RepID=A0ABW2FE17_9BACL